MSGKARTQIFLGDAGRGSKSRRAQRIADSIRREVSVLLISKVNDPGVQGVTITEVEVTSDLRIARVYFTVFGDEQRRKEALEGLARAKGLIRGHVAHALDLRYAPDLEFRPDLAAATGERMDAIFRELAAENE